ncbi:MAG: amidohydrolase family protein [Archaeoglobaceae archaeon]|nr:amidohydrolase family protein [Archaeoglobaceae archaeon]MDW8118781.1 amidohydrolase [Archaeoglobaceae archaeon]
MKTRASSSGFRGVLIDEYGIRHGTIFDGKFEESRTEYSDYVFTPTFFNAHTHLGDAIGKDPPFTDLKSLVAPGGYKFKILNSTSLEDLRSALVQEIEIAKSSGTSHFLDFREGGMEGLKVTSGIKGIITLGRPSFPEEAEKMECKGFGMSSARDHDLEFLYKIRKIARKRGIFFAIHAGEMDCEDVEKAIELEPDILVHMNSCPEFLKPFMDRGIPIVSCIRSNAFFGLLNSKAYAILSNYENWLLGTDNAMLFNPSLLEEMHFASIVVRKDLEVFKAGIRGFQLFGEPSGYVVFHRNRNLKNSKNIVSSIVRRVGIGDIECVILP